MERQKGMWKSTHSTFIQINKYLDSIEGKAVSIKTISGKLHIQNHKVYKYMKLAKKEGSVLSEKFGNTTYYANIQSRV